MCHSNAIYCFDTYLTTTALLVMICIETLAIKHKSFPVELKIFDQYFAKLKCIHSSLLTSTTLSDFYVQRYQCQYHIYQLS